LPTCTASCQHGYVIPTYIYPSIQFAAALSLSQCPGTVRPTFMFGRVDATFPAPDGTVPEPFRKCLRQYRR
jgi:hypothetical protein